MPPKPEPISKPFVAGRLIIAFARSASRRSNTGAPQPAGAPRTAQVMTPPTELPALRAVLTASIICCAIVGSGQRIGVASTWARVTFSTSHSIER